MVEDSTVAVNWLAQPDVDDVFVAMVASERVRNHVRSLEEILEQARDHSENCILRFRALQVGLTKPELQAIILYPMFEFKNECTPYLN